MPAIPSPAPIGGHLTHGSVYRRRVAPFPFPLHRATVAPHNGGSFWVRIRTGSFVTPPAFEFCPPGWLTHCS
jgi:hypothetical protein